VSYEESRGDLEGDAHASPRTMALYLAALYGMGALTGAITLVLPHGTPSDDAMLWTNVGLAAAGCALLAGFAPRMRVWMIHVGIVAGVLVISRAVYLSHDPGTFYTYWYVWVSLFAFFFFERRWAIGYLAFAGVFYAVTLAEIDAPDAVARWLMTIGTIAIAGVLTDGLSGRLKRRALEAATQARALEAVSDVAHELARRTNPEGAGLAVCEATARVAQADAVVLWEPGPTGNDLRATASTDPGLRDRAIPFVSSPRGAVRTFTTGEGWVRLEGGEVGEPAPDDTADGSALFEPVLRDGVPIGVLAVHWRQRLSGVAEDLRRTLQLLAVEAAIAIQREQMMARLELVARTDELTGLANRRAWDEHLSRELARSARENSPLAVAMLDLDHFKDYNDRFGHQAGDRVLKEAAAQWVTRLRKTDILARYGGEEFALALPNETLEDARETIERLREATPMGQKVSAGLAVWDGEEDAKQLLARADEALYEAKREGRDRVVTA
jgi:diguanylate cyclase (GGDEF)-like protein